MKSLSLSGLIFCLILFAACEKESECVKCNEAIQHMASKIGANNCNPNFMQNAVQRIKDDCGSRVNDAVGYLAENCYFNYNGSLSCTEIASGLAIYDNGERPIKLNFTNPQQPNDSLLVLLYDSPNFEPDNTAKVVAPVSQTIQYTGDREFGAPVFVAVIQLQTQDTVASGSKTISYNRQDEWQKLREINITYSQQFQSYTLDFVNW